MLRTFLRFVFQVNKYENRLLDGIRASEQVTVRTMFYDSLSDHKVIWEDIHTVYHLAREGSEDSIKRLQRDYKMKDDYGVKVSLRTPIFAERSNDEYYHSFYLEEVLKFYGAVLEERENRLKWEREKLERDIDVARKNETKNIAQTVNKIMNKQK